MERLRHSHEVAERLDQLTQRTRNELHRSFQRHLERHVSKLCTIKS